MARLSKKIMVAIAKDWALIDDRKDQFKDLGDNKFKIKKIFDNEVYRFSFKKRVIMTIKSGSGKAHRTDITGSVKEILRSIDALYRLNDKAAFREFFDIRYSNECGGILAFEENVVLIKASILGRRLKRMGFSDRALNYVCASASFIAENNCASKSLRQKIDYEKTFDYLWKDAQSDRAGQDFDGDKRDGYLRIPEF